MPLACVSQPHYLYHVHQTLSNELALAPVYLANGEWPGSPRLWLGPCQKTKNRTKVKGAGLATTTQKHKDSCIRPSDIVLDHLSGVWSTNPYQTDLPRLSLTPELRGEAKSRYSGLKHHQSARLKTGGENPVLQAAVEVRCNSPQPMHI